MSWRLGRREGQVGRVGPEGGAVDGLVQRNTASPWMNPGETYLLFLDARPGAEEVLFHDWRRIPEASASDLPDEGTLQRTWEATCRANPAGIYRWTPYTLVIPEGVPPSQVRILARVLAPWGAPSSAARLPPSHDTS